MKMEKRDDRYHIVDETGQDVVLIEKNAFGTHGHYRGYQAYRKAPDGRWMWTGVDPRFTGIKFDDPSVFMNLKEVRAYYGITV